MGNASSLTIQKGMDSFLPNNLVDGGILTSSFAIALLKSQFPTTPLSAHFPSAPTSTWMKRYLLNHVSKSEIALNHAE